MMSPRTWSGGAGARLRFLLVGMLASCSSSRTSTSSCWSPCQCWLSEEPFDSPLAFRTVLESFDSHGSSMDGSLTWNTYDSLDAIEEIVLLVDVFWDVPQTGIANYGGKPHGFDCIFDETRDDWTDQYLLRPLDHETVARVLAEWQTLTEQPPADE